MTTDGKNDERRVSRRQVLKASVGIIGAGLAMREDPVLAFEPPPAPPSAQESVIGMKFTPRDVVRVGGVL